MEDLEGEDDVTGVRYGEGEALVPHGTGGAGVIGLGGDAAVRIEVENSAGLEVAAAPVDVLQVLGGDDGDLGLQRERLRRRGGRRRGRRGPMRRRSHGGG